MRMGNGIHSSHLPSTVISIMISMGISMAIWWFFSRDWATVYPSGLPPLKSGMMEKPQEFGSHFLNNLSVLKQSFASEWCLGQPFPPKKNGRPNNPRSQQSSWFGRSILEPKHDESCVMPVCKKVSYDHDSIGTSSCQGPILLPSEVSEKHKKHIE